MGFFFFIIIGGIILWVILKRQGNLSEEWSRAAHRLRLSYSRGGLINPHWIYGRKAGLRFDVKTFSRSSSGSANQKWTGYRVRFDQSADRRIRVTESARKRLSSRFQECEIDENGIFCARPGIESDAPAIIDNVERLQSIVARLLAAAEEETTAPGNPASPIPPPLPPQTPEPSRALPVQSPPGEAESPPEASVPPVEIVENSSSPDDSELRPERRESVFEPVEEPVEEPETILETEPLPSEAPKVDSGGDPQPIPETESESSEAESLATVSRDLFDSGRNHFQITQQFDAEYRGRSMIGEGKLVRAEPYSNDRIFGRGPGNLAEIEIHHPEEPLPGHRTIKAVLQLPETPSARALREHVGEPVTLSGTLLRCDAFEGRIFLGSGEMA